MVLFGITKCCQKYLKLMRFIILDISTPRIMEDAQVTQTNVSSSEILILSSSVNNRFDCTQSTLLSCVQIPPKSYFAENEFKGSSEAQWHRATACSNPCSCIVVFTPFLPVNCIHHFFILLSN